MEAPILGQTGWRLPTTAELSALYASGAITGQGWALYEDDFGSVYSETWSSTPYGAGSHYNVDLSDGYVGWFYDAYNAYVSCVR